MGKDRLAKAALARTASVEDSNTLLSNTAAKLSSITSSFGLSFSGNSVTSNATTGRLDDIEDRTVPSLGGDYLIGYSDTAVLTSQTATITLPVPKIGFKVSIKKIDDIGVATVVPNATEVIDGMSSTTLVNQWEYVTLVSDGVNWYKVG